MTKILTVLSSFQKCRYLNRYVWKSYLKRIYEKTKKLVFLLERRKLNFVQFWWVIFVKFEQFKVGLVLYKFNKLFFLNINLKRDASF